jgi:hypothetical protein
MFMTCFLRCSGSRDMYLATSRDEHHLLHPAKTRRRHVEAERVPDGLIAPFLAGERYLALSVAITGSIRHAMAWPKTKTNAFIASAL